MTEKEIENMESGREMDALVAEKVMGCKLEYGGIGGNEPHCYESVPDTAREPWNGYRYEHGTMQVDSRGVWAPSTCIPLYSADITAAMKVVGKLKGVRQSFALTTPIGNDEHWIATFREEPFNKRYAAYADTAPLAICRAALKAVA